MSLFRSSLEVPERNFDMQSASFSTKVAYGENASIMVAVRPGGYHSKPHVHATEQINYVQEGELWSFYIEPHTNKCISIFMKEGDIKRVPPNAIHWSWNRSDKPCTLVEFHSPGIQDDPINKNFSVPLFADYEEIPSFEPAFNVFTDSSIYDKSLDDMELGAIEKFKSGDSDTGILSSVETQEIDRQQSKLLAKIGYGENGSVMYSKVLPNYHARPIFQDCEQLTYVVEGEVYGYIAGPNWDRRVFHLKKGDFWRIPSMAVYWIWNKSDAPCELVSFHTPGLQDDPMYKDVSYPLFASYESKKSLESGHNFYVDPDLYPIKEIEESDF